jgi:1-phosphofructokinase
MNHHDASVSQGRGHNGSVCVLDPGPYLEVTIEPGSHDDDELHLHPAGQGFWIARMAARLGADVTLVAPFGGETGRVLQHLIVHEGLRTAAVVTEGANGSVVHDRRAPDNAATSIPEARLARHDRDDLHGAAFSSAVNADVFVLAGTRSPVLDDELYEHLAHDVRRNGVTVIADLSGDTLAAALAGGIDLLKVSDDQLRKDGYLSGEDRDDILRAIDDVRQAGASNVVVSRSRAPTVAAIDDDLWELRGPDVEPVDSHGGGDSMTGALATALAAGDAHDTAVRLAMAAATTGVLRHGLASARREDIERLAQRVAITSLT